jgi:tripartite-type tricarboxylate transporter receptor subunit TctC
MLTSPASAENYPSRTIRVVVPFTPGGASDVVARIVGQKLSERLGQPVVVDNRPGAGGNIGAELVARAEPDGYTLLAGAIVAHAVNMTLQKRTVRFDLIKDFSPIAMAASVPVVLVVNPSVPVKNVEEFIAYAKQRQGAMTYASAGIGSTQHLAGELFKLLIGVNMRHVPYRGSAPAVNDVVAGQVECTFETGPVILSQVQGKTVRPLLVANDERLLDLPDVPTAAEAGVAGFEVAGQYGFLAPAQTPAPVIDRLNKEINEILQLPDVKEKLSGLGAFVMSTTPDEMKDHLRKEVAKWAKVIDDAHLETQ